MAFHFFSEEIDFVLKQPLLHKRWLKEVAHQLNYTVGNVNFIFASDDYVRNINNTFLKHDYNTDVITFDETDKHVLTGDIFISIHTVRSNSLDLKVDFDIELKRVMVHGILHMSGFDDLDEISKNSMRLKEDEFLDLASTHFF